MFTADESIIRWNVSKYPKGYKGEAFDAVAKDMIRMEEAARNFTHIENGGSIDEYVAAVTRSFLYLAHADNDEKNYGRLVTWVEEWMGE